MCIFKRTFYDGKKKDGKNHSICDLIKDQTNIYCFLIIRLIFVLQRNLNLSLLQNFYKLKYITERVLNILTENCIYITDCTTW